MRLSAVVLSASKRSTSTGVVFDALFSQLRRVLAPLLRDDADRALLDRTQAAATLGYARLALRHGRLGRDFHPYHNEAHILDLCGTRLDRLMQTIGPGGLPLRDWCALILFGACHDLRQREAPRLVDGVGANERASWEEAERILAACGFDAQQDESLRIALELAIAGSTFDARPRRPAGGVRCRRADIRVENPGSQALAAPSSADDEYRRGVAGWKARARASRAARAKSARRGR